MIDAGCGSGILSIAAVKLGAASVFAMDIDELAVRIARENIELNGLADKIQARVGDIVTDIRVRQADMVLANITAEVVTELIPEAAKVIKSGGCLFGSGIVDSRWPTVHKALQENGFVIEQVLQDVDWIGVAARR